MSGRLGSPGRRIRKEGNYGQKAVVFCAKVLHFCAKVPLFSTRSAHPSAGGARFCAGSRASFERRAYPIFWGIREKGVYMCLILLLCCMTNGRLPLPRNRPFRLLPAGHVRKRAEGGLLARPRKSSCYTVCPHGASEGSRLGSKQPEIVCRVKKRPSRAVLLPR